MGPYGIDREKEARQEGAGHEMVERTKASVLKNNEGFQAPR